jgi:D-xylose 1-dehydrogenase (NADP+, D-xylono-1,5-lactone-forming)
MFIPGVRDGSLGDVVAVGSRDLDTARSFAADLDIGHAFGTYDALLGSDIDAVYVALPNSLHPEWVIRAAVAGKHVLCEKPLASRAEDAERMADACRRAGVLLMEAFMWRHHPQHARVRELLQNGAIGEPRLVRSSFTYAIDWSAPNVRLQADLEGGSLMDVGCYAVNAARWLLQAEPTGVTASARIEPRFGIDAQFDATLRFGNASAEIHSSFDEPFGNVYEVHGTHGVLRVPRAFRPDSDPGVIEIDGRVEEIPAVNQYAEQADHFSRSVRTGRLLPPAEDGVAQTRVMDTLLRSAGLPR